MLLIQLGIFLDRWLCASKTAHCLKMMQRYEVGVREDQRERHNIRTSHSQDQFIRPQNDMIPILLISIYMYSFAIQYAFYAASKQ